MRPADSRAQPTAQRSAAAVGSRPRIGAPAQAPNRRTHTHAGGIARQLGLAWIARRGAPVCRRCRIRCYTLTDTAAPRAPRSEGFPLSCRTGRNPCAAAHVRSSTPARVRGSVRSLARPHTHLVALSSSLLRRDDLPPGRAGLTPSAGPHRADARRPHCVRVDESGCGCGCVGAGFREGGGESGKRQKTLAEYSIIAWTTVRSAALYTSCGSPLRGACTAAPSNPRPTVAEAVCLGDLRHSAASALHSVRTHDPKPPRRPLTIDMRPRAWIRACAETSGKTPFRHTTSHWRSPE
jgi:hypothetical protein